MAALTTNLGWGDEFGPWPYTLLDEDKLTSELTRVSGAKMVEKIVCLSFQPASEPSQDRHTIQEWDLPDGVWKFSAVFDGHAGHEAADVAVEQLPSLIQATLAAVLTNAESSPLSSELVSNILTKSVEDFDASLKRGLEGIFPGGVEAIEKLSEEEISKIVNDGGPNNLALHRAIRGSTALVALVDPKEDNLWVASLGDCQAVFGFKDKQGAWKSQVLSSYHNGQNESEANRIRAEHPGEPECFLIDHTGARVLGSIAVTRALGDMFFKLPRTWHDHVFRVAQPGIKMSAKLEAVLPRNLTPPYLTATPEVQHVSLSATKGSERCLILCSDGLIDLYDKFSKEIPVLGQKWVEVVAAGARTDKKGYENRALWLLRDALGGDDLHRVSAYLTVEKEGMIMDDTTVLVQGI